MPIARTAPYCGAANAFQLRYAVWKLFLEQQHTLPSPRCFSASSRIRASEQGEATADIQIPATNYIETGSLSRTLENLRARNRGAAVYNSKYGRPGLKGLGRAQALHAIGNDPNKDNLAEDQDPVDTVEFFTNLKTLKSKKKETITSTKLQRTPSNVLEYTGRYVIPTSGEMSGNQTFPWTKGLEGQGGVMRLSREIDLFLQYIKPTKAEQAARTAVVEQTRELIHNLLPDHSTEVFGSQRTGLTLATSDVDLRLYEEGWKLSEGFEAEKAPRYRVRRELKRDLNQVHYNFDRNRDYILCRLRHARYPLITMMHKQSGIDIQVVCSNDTSASRDIIKRYIDADPTLFSLYAVSKVMFDLRGLSDVFRGGLGSYSLFMMIVVALKLKEVRKDAPLGEKLLAILEFYSVYDPYKDALAIEPPSIHPKIRLEHQISEEEKQRMVEDPVLEGRYRISMIDSMQPYLLCLQDPADPLNDLGRKGYGFKHIQATMRHLLKKLQKYTAHENHGTTSILAPLVGSCFKTYSKRREMAEAYGRERLENTIL